MAGLNVRHVRISKQTKEGLTGIDKNGHSQEIVEQFLCDTIGAKGSTFNRNMSVNLFQSI